MIHIHYTYTDDIGFSKKRKKTAKEACIAGWFPWVT